MQDWKNAFADGYVIYLLKLINPPSQMESYVKSSWTCNDSWRDRDFPLNYWVHIQAWKEKQFLQSKKIPVSSWWAETLGISNQSFIVKQLCKLWEIWKRKLDNRKARY